MGEQELYTENYKMLLKGIPGWLSSLAPAFGPGRDPGVPDQVPHQAPYMEPASPCVSPSLCVSFTNK